MRLYLSRNAGFRMLVMSVESGKVSKTFVC
jgi:hypothetical protein